MRRRAPGRTFARDVAPIALTGDHSRGLVICYRDVTDERRDAAQRRIAEHVAAVGQLVASVAHEFDNPLSYVTGNVDLVTEEIARRGRPEDAPMVEALEDARIGVTRITAVVRDLGTLSRSDEEHVAPVDMRAVVESALKMAQNQLHHHTRIVRRFDDIPPVMGNEARLGQVLLNLLINAAHALPEGRANEMHTQVQRERPELLERFVFMSGGAFTPTLRSFFENVQARASRSPSRIVSSRASSTASHGSVASADQPE